MSRDLAEATGAQDQIAIVRKHIAGAGRGEVHIVLDDGAGQGSISRWPEDGVFESVAVRVAATWAYEQGQSAGWGTAHCAEAEAWVLPLRSGTRITGIVALQPQDPAEELPTSARRLVEALTDQAAIFFERAVLAGRNQQAQVEIQSEQLRTALLSSLSHDLRTPLSSIEGAASSLLQEAGMLSADSRRQMAETILEESRRMNRLVANLLDMVRVETGALAVHKEWQVLEEALGVALLRLEDRLADHPLEARLPATLPLVPIDELLIEQVFINLLENAIRHTPAGTPIRISAWAEPEAVFVEVADQGGGIPEGEAETIFRKFQRSSSADRAGPAGGSGLGLTICRGIISAHGGEIWLEPKGGKGAAFRFSLPLEGQRPTALPAEALES